MAMRSTGPPAYSPRNSISCSAKIVGGVADIVAGRAALAAAVEQVQIGRAAAAAWAVTLPESIRVTDAPT